MGSLEPSGRPDPEDRFRHALMRSDGHAAITRAETVFRRFGASVESTENPRSASNDVWLVDGLCLRMSRRAGPDSLFDEVRLATMLPPEVGYPKAIATGVEDGHQWVLSQRLPGLNLWDAWPALTHDQRMTTVEEVWERHVALQRIELDLLTSLRLPPPRRYRFDRAAATRQLRNLVEAGVLEDGLAPSI